MHLVIDDNYRQHYFKNYRNCFLIKGLNDAKQAAGYERTAWNKIIIPKLAVNHLAASSMPFCA